MDLVVVATFRRDVYTQFIDEEKRDEVIRQAARLFLAEENPTENPPDPSPDSGLPPHPPDLFQRVKVKYFGSPASRAGGWLAVIEVESPEDLWAYITPPFSLLFDLDIVQYDSTRGRFGINHMAPFPHW